MSGRMREVTPDYELYRRLSAYAPADSSAREYYLRRALAELTLSAGGE